MSWARECCAVRTIRANAAWLRLAVATHNVLTALKRLALPPEFLAARPKRLRFLIFHTAGRLVEHARQMVLRVATTVERLRMWLKALRDVPLPAWFADPYSFWPSCVSPARVRVRCLCFPDSRQPSAFQRSVSTRYHSRPLFFAWCQPCRCPTGHDRGAHGRIRVRHFWLPASGRNRQSAVRSGRGLCANLVIAGPAG